MADWTTISNTVLEVGKPIRSIDIIALKDNITAAFEKAAGAPVLANNYVVEAMINAAAVTEGKLGASAVSQGKLKTTTASSSASIGSGSTATQALTGGTYSWWTAATDNDNLAADDIAFIGGAGDVVAGSIAFGNTSGVALNYYIDERYVQASPPYNLGNGDIAQFIFLLVASDGTVRGISVGADPTWAYHGPTDIRAERYEAGRAFRRYHEIGGVPMAKALQDRETMRRFIAGEISPELVEREITQAIKNADRDLFPHPWCPRGNNLLGLTAVILDPCSALVDRLAMMASEAGAREVRRLIEAGYLAIGNMPLQCVAPAGVMPVSASWK